MSNEISRQPMPSRAKPPEMPFGESDFASLIGGHNPAEMAFAPTDHEVAVVTGDNGSSAERRSSD